MSRGELDESRVRNPGVVVGRRGKNTSDKRNILTNGNPLTPAARLAVLAVVAFVCFAGNAAAGDPLLRPGDRISFFGDSSTGAHGYTCQIADVFALGQGAPGVTFRASGTEQLWRALGTVNAWPAIDCDVISVRPKVVGICFGLDDLQSKPLNKSARDRFKENLTDVIRRAKKSGARVLVMTPPCPTPPQRADDVQEAKKLAEIVREIATSESLQRIDLFAAMTDASARAQRAGRTLEWTAGPALTPSGHALTMCLVLDALGVKPRISSAELDLKADAVGGTHCSVTRPEKHGGTYTFKRTDHCLPTAFSQSAHAALDFVSVPHNWDSYRVKVVGLPAGSWRITVEGTVAGTFTAEALANGLDLGRSPGPWQAQAKKIHEESLALEEQFRSRCRNGARPKIPEEAESLRSAFVRRLDDLIEAREAKRLRIDAKSSPWTWSLSPIGAQP
jgi:hypothetical protein